MRPPGPFRRIRQNLGLTLEEFSSWAGVSRSTLSSVENGEHCGNPETLEKILAAIRRLPKPDPLAVEAVDLTTPDEALEAEFQVIHEGAREAVDRIECGAEGAEREALMELLRLALDRLEQINYARQLRAKRPA